MEAVIVWAAVVDWLEMRIFVMGHNWMMSDFMNKRLGVNRTNII